MEETSKELKNMGNPTRLFFAGDFCSKPSTSIITVSEELRELILSCNLRVVNFEVPLKPNTIQQSVYWERFFQNDDAPEFLKQLGFNIFPFANNHAFDWGVEGFKKTINCLGENTFGSGTYEDAYKVKVIECNGIKIGFLALCFAARTGVFHDISSHQGLSCAYINDLLVNHIIIDAKKDVDYLFVLPHDGIEYIDAPIPEVIARYRDFIDYGADGVVGTHPHCPQGWEEYKGKPIFYSLGNFFFNSKNDPSYHATCPHWYEGLCAVVEIDNHNLSWKVTNTINHNNTELSIDQNPNRYDYNRQNCNYLHDDNAYWSYLRPALETSAKFDLSVMDESLGATNLKHCLKLISKRINYLTKGIYKYNDPQLAELVHNDTRCKALYHYIKQK